MHSSAFRGRPQVEGKRVLIVGAGESGADIVALTAEGAAQTVLSLRRGAAVVPRMAFGGPRDYQTTRLMNSPADWIHQTRNPDHDHKRAVYRWAFFPAVVVDKVCASLARARELVAPLAPQPNPASPAGTRIRPQADAELALLSRCSWQPAVSERNLRYIEGIAPLGGRQ